MGRWRTPGSQKKTWNMPKKCSGHSGSPVGAGQENDSVFGSNPWATAATCRLFLLVLCGCSNRWAALLLVQRPEGCRMPVFVFCLGVHFPQDGCVVVLYCTLGVWGFVTCCLCAWGWPIPVRQLRELWELCLAASPPLWTWSTPGGTSANHCNLVHLPLPLPWSCLAVITFYVCPWVLSQVRQRPGGGLC